jgi:predicted enzyme related to lactoylglutathione lyase
MDFSLVHLTFDCDNPELVANFWVAATGYEKKVSNERMAYLASGKTGVPDMLFMKVPEAKTVKNRMHIDFETGDREGQIKRLVELGAKELETHHDFGTSWTVMADPEGNEFCVVQSRQKK